MAGFSLWHWLILVVFIVPMWRIVSRAGFHGAWSLLMVVPLLNLVLLWVFAFMRWPRDQAGR